MAKGYTHGTQSCYTHQKCRCLECKAANAKYSKKIRARRQKDLTAIKTHGTIYGYNYGCRCDPCRLARTQLGRANRYGMTENEYQGILKSQEGKCAICRKVPNTRFHVDHDHITGKVRGLLCPTCNTGMGKLGDTVESLMQAVNYLQRT